MSAALDLLGRRWALRLIWELRRDAVSFSELPMNAVSFSELRRRTGISPSVLSARLSELEEARLVEQQAGRRYRLSGTGRELAQLLYDLNRWAERAWVSSQRELA